MKEKNQSGIIPGHHTGRLIDTVKSIECANTDEARVFFKEVQKRLLQVNRWHDLMTGSPATFQVTDASGNEVDRMVTKGDHFKINIPGPGPSAGDGYDWVQVEEIRSVSEGDMESTGIRVRPSADPRKADTDIAHFYSPESTSNFTVTREGNRITAGIYDRNTKPNTDGGSKDKARDLLVGLGAVAGFSRFQWDKLAAALLKR
ncbi:MAG TPA: hypothetical protein VGE15_13945 [Sphingobacteriaceae bacterium]